MGSIADRIARTGDRDERGALAVEMHLAGYTYSDIAERLGIGSRQGAHHVVSKHRYDANHGDLRQRLRLELAYGMTPPAFALPPQPPTGTEISVKRAATEYGLHVPTLYRWVRRGDMGITILSEPENPGDPLLIDASTAWTVAREYHRGAGKGRRTAIRFGSRAS